MLVGTDDCVCVVFVIFTVIMLMYVFTVGVE